MNTPASAPAQPPADEKSPFTDFQGEAPGNVHHITAADLPAPYATKSSAVFSRPVPRGECGRRRRPVSKSNLRRKPQGDDGKAISPRTIITAPNGDLFVAATNQGAVSCSAPRPDGKCPDGCSPQLSLPFGLAFYPPGPDPKYLYVGDTDAVLRFPYAKGDLKATGDPETIVADLPSGPNHFSRGVAFSLDGKRMFISVGSHNNVTDTDADKSEFHRADILVGSQHQESGRQDDRRLRLGNSQRRSNHRESHHRRALDLGKRARRARRQSSARLHHARPGGRILRLAVVLHRRQSGPALPGQASGVERQGDRARRADGTAQRFLEHHFLRRRSSSPSSTRETSSGRSTDRGTDRCEPATKLCWCRRRMATRPASIRIS